MVVVDWLIGWLVGWLVRWLIDLVDNSYTHSGVMDW